MVRSIIIIRGKMPGKNKDLGQDLKMKHKTLFIIAFVLLFLLSLLYIMTKPARIIPAGIESSQASYFDFSQQAPLTFEFSGSSLAEFEEYLGTPRRIFHGCKDQVFLHMKLSDAEGKQYHLFFLDTKSKPCIVKSGDHYFRIQRSSDELRNYIKQHGCCENTPEILKRARKDADKSHSQNERN